MKDAVMGMIEETWFGQREEENRREAEPTPVAVVAPCWSNFPSVSRVSSVWIVRERESGRLCEEVKA